MICPNCKSTKCKGYFLLHPKELSEIEDLKAQELAKDNTVKFKLIASPSSGEIFTKFKELHVIEEVCDV